jgi:hypothetical protein
VTAYNRPTIISVAFLQAAFIGMNWNNSKWWMAQAPGPRAMLSTVTSLQNSSETITAIAGQSLWTSSWDSIWTPLAEQNANGDNLQPPSANASGLSPGTKAGAAALLGAAFLLLRRHKRHSNKTSSGVPLNEPYPKYDDHHQQHQQQQHDSQPMFILELQGAENEHSDGNWAVKPAVQVFHEMPSPNTPTSIPEQSHASHGT